ncbi:hypothetical protein KY092_12745 [Natronomonas gomsonensis]|uniref:DUF7344 domain-containing protein n=1 Tax=Natronomonas gomsonensis TaxID=1046043 RepID=UPI0020CA85CB|nr:hypothetical protein [Natronomonas gomsonensis]MCY4731420.1 hypothetical protein [Natronomonas gomsonensis]
MYDKLPRVGHIGTDSGGRELACDDIFDILSNDRRRCIVHYLKKHDDRRVDLGELVDYVAAWETDTPIDKLDGDKRKSVYAAIRQTHLPKMEKAGIIEYEHMRGEVELTDCAREVQLYLEYVPGNDIPWSELYLGQSAVAISLIAVAWTGIYPFGLLSAWWLALGVATVFTVTAATHTYQSRQRRLGTGEYEIETPG